MEAKFPSNGTISETINLARSLQVLQDPVTEGRLTQIEEEAVVTLEDGTQLCFNKGPFTVVTGK